MTTQSWVGFREVQRFRQPWLWLLLLAIAGIHWYIVVRQVVMGEPVGDNPASNGVVVLLWLLFGIGFQAGFWWLALVTEVRVEGLRVGFPPLSRRLIPWREIRDARAVTYHPVREFGGWGYRWGYRGRRAYNVSGNRGVELTLANGKQIVIGSRRPDELAAAINRAREAFGSTATQA